MRLTALETVPQLVRIMTVPYILPRTNRLGKISEKGPRKSAEGIFMYKLGTTFS